jgi:hypothetical protein
MNRKIKYGLVLALTFVLVAVSTAQEVKSFLSVQDILAGWQKNYGSLKSMKVSYSEEIISAEPSQKDPNITNRLVKWTYVERTEEGKKFRAKSSVARVRPPVAKDSFADINSVEEVTFDGIHQNRYLPAQNTGQVFAGLTQKNVGTGNLLKKYLLSEPYLTSASVKVDEEPEFSKIISKALSDPNLTVSVRPVLEEIAGQMCHVLDIEFIKKDNTKGKMAVIWVAHEKGMLPMKIQEFGGGTMSRERAVEQIDSVKTKDGVLWFPKKAYEVLNLPASLGVIKQEFNVLEFVPDIQVDPNTFQLNFPNGTQVADVELGLEYKVGVKQH